jgi:hypothetical protein
MLDFRFSQHPKCPRCGAQRTQSALFGMPATNDIPPWLAIRGCLQDPRLLDLHSVRIHVVKQPDDSTPPRTRRAFPQQPVLGP